MDITELHAGQVIKDYKQLCSLTDLECTSGNAKTAQIKELQRWVEIKMVGHQFRIIQVYPIVKPKDDLRDIYKQHLQFILLDYIARFGNAELTKSQIMLMCGMCNPRYFQLEHKDWLQANQDQVTEFDLKDFYRRMGLKFSKIIDSAVLGLGSNYCYCLVRIAATPLGFKLSSKYVQAQEVLCEYLLEI